MRWIAVAAALLFWNNASAAPCDQSPGRFQAFAAKASVQLDAPKQFVVGSDARIGVRWGFDQSKLPAGTPVYLIVAADSMVRFEGPGYLALSEDASNPKGITFGTKKIRAVLPLHNPTVDSTGAIAIRPLKAGPIRIDWAIVANTGCGEKVVSQGSLDRTIDIGKPRLVIQNPYTLETPDRINVSPDGKYRLHVFHDRFRVFDGVTGALVIEASGREASFSPTGRFVSAYDGGEDRSHFSIFDLDAGEMIVSDIGEALVWQNADSVVVFAAGRYQKMEARQTLIDDEDDDDQSAAAGREDCDADLCGSVATLASFFGCNGCGAAWEKVKFAVSADSGVAAVWSRDDDSGRWDASLFSLGRPVVTEKPDSDSDAKQVTRSVLRQLTMAAPPMPSDVLAAGKTSHAPPSGWDPWGTRQGDDGYTLRQVAGVQQLRSRLATYPNVNQATNAVLAPLAAQAAGTFTEQLRDELSAVGVNLFRKNKLLSNEVTAVSFVTNDDSEIYSTSKFTHDLKALLQPFVNMPGGKVINRSANCKSEDLNDQFSIEKGKRTGRIHAACSHGLWAFQRGYARYLVVQILYHFGTAHEELSSNTYLLVSKPGRRLQVVDLSDFLPGDMTRDEGKDRSFPWSGNIHTVSLAGNRFLIFASSGDGHAHVFDLDAMAPLGFRVSLKSPDLLRSVYLTDDAKHLLQLNADGGLTLSRLTDGSALLTGRAIDDELLLAASDGRYEGTAEGGQFVFLAFEGNRDLNNYRQFETSLRTPGLVKSMLAGQEVDEDISVAPPPEVELDIAHESLETLSLHIRTASVSRLAKLRILLDGVPAGERDLNGTSQDISVDIPYRAGAKVVTALVTDSSGTVSGAVSRSLTLSTPPDAALRVLAVGIDDYKGDDFSPLSSASSDARLISASLGQGSGKLFHSRLIQAPITNEAATPATVRKALEQLVETAKAGDTVAFFFAGHGALDPRTRRLWLATDNSTFANLSSTALAWDDVVAILSRAPTRVLVFLDACHSGATDFDQVPKNDVMVQSLLNGVRAPILVLAASKGRQSSLEDSHGGGGVFTRAVVEALRDGSADQDKRGYVGPRELYYSVKRKVSNLVGDEQTPWLARSDIILDFPVLETTGLTATPASPAPTATNGIASASQFVRDYWKGWSGSGPAPTTFLRGVFADDLNFYGQHLARDAVIADRVKYADRWPVRSFSVKGDQLGASCSKTECVVAGLVEFKVSNEAGAGHQSSGTSSFKILLRPTGGSFRIVDESGTVTVRN